MKTDSFIFRITYADELFPIGPGRFIYSIKEYFFHFSCCLFLYTWLILCARVACRNLASSFKADKALWQRLQSLWINWQKGRSLLSIQRLDDWAMHGWSCVIRPTICRLRERKICRGLKSIMTASVPWKPSLNSCPRNGTTWPGKTVIHDLV